MKETQAATGGPNGNERILEIERSGKSHSVETRFGRGYGHVVRHDYILKE
jgi:hypothetical protein